MKAFRILDNCIKDAFKSVFRNFSLSLAAISCIVITLIIVSCSIVLSRNVENFATIVEDDVEIHNYISNDIENLESVKEQIESIDNVASVTLSDKEEQKQKAMEDDKTFAEIMQEWSPDENPLRNVYVVKIADVTLLRDTAQKLESIEGIDIVAYGDDAVETMLSTFTSLEKGSYVVVIALVLVTIFLIVNTIKLTIFSRKREISIMRLVGASNLTIKIPFVIEGILLGIIGSIIPIAIVVFGYPYLYQETGGILYSSLIRLVEPNPFIYTTSLIILIIGMAVGMLGSSSAVRRYLKV